MGIMLFFQLLRTPGANTFISPTSIAQAWHDQQLGGGLDPAGHVQRPWHFGAHPGQVNLDNAALLASLLSADGQVTLTIANSLWTRSTGLPAFGSDPDLRRRHHRDLSGAPATATAWATRSPRGSFPRSCPPH